MRPNRPTHIIVHCSDSPWGDASVIDEWHRERGFSGGIGYHFVILNGHRRTSRVFVPEDDGLLEAGRPEEVEGAHCPGYNRRSIGVCLVGRKGHFTLAQLQRLRILLTGLMQRYGIPVEHVLGHAETPNGRSQGKTCPELDMDQLRKELKEAA